VKVRQSANSFYCSRAAGACVCAHALRDGAENASLVGVEPMTARGRSTVANRKAVLQSYCRMGERRSETGRGDRRRRGRWRVRVAVAVLALGLLGLAALRVALPRIAENRLRAALALAGFPRATLRVKRVGLGAIELSDLALAEVVRASSVSIEYRLADLWRGRVEGVRVRGLVIELPEFTRQGDLSLADGGIPALGRLPLRWIEVQDARVIAGAGGAFEMMVSGRIAVSPGAADVAAAGAALGVPFTALGRMRDAAETGLVGLITAGVLDEGAMLARIRHRAGAWSLAALGESARLSGRARLAARLDGDGASAAWQLVGAPPPAVVRALAASGVALEQPSLVASGRAHWRPDEPARVLIDGAELDLRAQRARAEGRGAGLWANRVVARLNLAGELDRGSATFELRRGSRVAAARVRLAGAAAAGDRPVENAVSADAVSMEVSGRIHCGVAGSVDCGSAGSRVELAPEVSARARVIRRGVVALEDARVRLLPGQRGGRAGVAVHGRVRIRGERIGRMSAVLRPRGRGVGVRGALALDGGGRLEARGRFRSRPGRLAGHLDFEMPATLLALAPVAARLAGERLTARLSGAGRIALHGRVEFAGGAPTGWARISLADASLRAGGLELSGVRADVRVASLSPLATAGEQRIAFARGRIGDVPLGAGWLGLDRRAGATELRARAHVLGGTAWTSTWVHGDEARGAQPVRLTARDLDLRKILPRLTRGRARGTGRVSGALSAEASLRPVALRITGGHLAATRPGRIAIPGARDLLRSIDARARQPAVVQAVPRLLRDRIVGALCDFDYTKLALDLNDRRGELLLRLDLHGHGHRIPQELSVALHVRGLERLATRLEQR
jgi:hypothetical protein